MLSAAITSRISTSQVYAIAVQLAVICGHALN